MTFMAVSSEKFRSHNKKSRLDLIRPRRQQKVTDAFSVNIREGFFIAGRLLMGKPKLGFIGAGKVGTSLAIKLSAKGYPVVAVTSRSPASTEKFASLISGSRIYATPQQVVNNCELIFITTPDDVIREVATSISWLNGKSVVHCSGALSLDTLAGAAAKGVNCGTFHPLQTFADIKQAVANLPGSTIAIEGNEPLLGTLKEMALAVGGNPIVLKAGDKEIYHASAVIACNYLVTLFKLSTDLWQTFDVPPEDASSALMPLLKGTLNNIATTGIPQCLTGPLARGDINTIQKHVKSLAITAPAICKLYCELGLATVPIALMKGSIEEEQAGYISAFLENQLKRMD